MYHTGFYKWAWGGVQGYGPNLPVRFGIGNGQLDKRMGARKKKLAAGLLTRRSWWGAHTHPGLHRKTMVPAPLQSSIKGYVSTNLSTLLTAEGVLDFTDQNRADIVTTLATIISNSSRGH